MTEPDKRCGTCRWWGDGTEYSSGRRDCVAPIPESVADEYKFVMRPDDGTTCPCWEAKE